MSYQSEFGGFDLDVEIPEGFEDISWHNDAMPSWWNPEKNLRLWIDYKDKKDSEFSDTEDWNRFGLVFQAEEVEGNELLCLTNDYNEILEVIKAYER